MNFTRAILAESEQLPPIEAWYEYVVAGNGLFIRAEDSRMRACIPVTHAWLRGLADVEPHAELKVPRVPGSFLRSVLRSARSRMSKEVMYQFTYHADVADDGATRSGWRCTAPGQVGSSAAVTFDDLDQAVVDLHSHHRMRAFFSTTDDADERGLRFYAVIGRIDTERPQIRVRAGVYGHHWPVPAWTVFDNLELFEDGDGEDDESEEDPEDEGVQEHVDNA